MSGGKRGSWAPACPYACTGVALLIQHAMRMPHTVLPFVASMAPPHYSTLSHKDHDFKKVTERKIRVIILS